MEIMSSDYNNVELIGKASNLVSQTAKMRVGAANEYCDIVATNATRNEDRLLRDQDLFQGISH
jgi:hypothetical protein